MGRIKFSIIVPVYNVEQYLEKCVRSLVQQEDAEGQVEILLIDDGSKDQSGTICDCLTKKYEQIRTYHKENGGLSSARNFGMKKAVGEYILFVDSDDFIDRAACKILRNVLNREGTVDVIAFDGMEDTEGHYTSMRRFGPEKNQKCSGKQYLLEHYRNRNMSMEACLYAFRRNFLVENQIWFQEGILHEDVEFTPRTVLQAKTIVEISDKLYYYIIRENSISTQKNKEKNIRDLFATLIQQEKLARQQEKELQKWMLDGILNSYLNMIQEARMYQRQYKTLLDKRFLLGKAATSWNKFRVLICLINVHLYCWMNDCYKKVKSGS